MVFDDSEPVQKILSNRVSFLMLSAKELHAQLFVLARDNRFNASFLLQPIKFRGDVRLNVEEKKTRSAREGDRRDARPRGPGGPRERVGGSGGPRGPSARGGTSQKPSFGSGRGAGPSEGRYPAPRQ